MQYTHGGDIYTYGEMIDFSVNINPLGPSKKVIEAAKRALLQSAAYPDCKCRKLRENWQTGFGWTRGCLHLETGRQNCSILLSWQKNRRKLSSPFPRFQNMSRR